MSDDEEEGANEMQFLVGDMKGVHKGKEVMMMKWLRGEIIKKIEEFDVVFDVMMIACFQFLDHHLLLCLLVFRYHFSVISPRMILEWRIKRCRVAMQYVSIYSFSSVSSSSSPNNHSSTYIHACIHKNRALLQMPYIRSLIIRFVFVY
jgi:hypothetical protein